MVLSINIIDIGKVMTIGLWISLWRIGPKVCSNGGAMVNLRLLSYHLGNESIKNVAVWVPFSGLPIEYYDCMASRFFVAIELGMPSRKWGKHARLYVWSWILLGFDKTSVGHVGA